MSPKPIGRVSSRIPGPAPLALSALALCSLVAGCSSLPGDGPVAKSVIEQSSGENYHAARRYEVVDIDSTTVATLRRRRPDGFAARFGDYRPSADLRIGPGDIVGVTLWEADANGLFTAPLATDRFSTGSKSTSLPAQAVTRDGMITVPYAGRVKAAGLTAKAVQAEIEKALEGKAVQPQALVSILKSTSNAVTVTGESITPTRHGAVELSTRGDRILDAVAEAGGVQTPVSQTTVRLSRGGRTVAVPMARVVADPRENIFLRPEDVLTLVREPRTFSAYGATGRQAQIPFDAESIALSEAIAKAGGVDDTRADPAGVFIFRFEPPAVARTLRPGAPPVQAGWVPVVYRLNMRDPASLFLAQSFPIFDKDVLFVSNAPYNEAQKAFEVFDTLTAPVTSTAAMAVVVP